MNLQNFFADLNGATLRRSRFLLPLTWLIDIATL
jgi:hypothetical protein